MSSKISFRCLAFAALLLITTLPALAQRRRDPLTDAEVDQLREQAQNPEDRLKLWVKFTRARIVAMDQLRGDPKLAAERPQRIHDLIEDLGEMVGEIDDNMSTYAKDRWDIRKELKEIVEMTSELEVKLRSLKEATDPESVKELPTYRFVLQDTTEAVKNLADDARDALDQQNEQAKEKDPAKKLRKVQK
jgi:uncharacterized coiled-coil DUF342 family protein